MHLSETWRIRRSNGNRACWTVALLNADGTECGTVGSWSVHTSAADLLAHAEALVAQGARVEIQLVGQTLTTA